MISDSGKLKHNLETKIKPENLSLLKLEEGIESLIKSIKSLRGVDELSEEKIEVYLQDQNRIRTLSASKRNTLNENVFTLDRSGKDNFFDTDPLSPPNQRNLNFISARLFSEQAAGSSKKATNFGRVFADHALFNSNQPVSSNQIMSKRNSKKDVANFDGLREMISQTRQALNSSSQRRLTTGRDYESSIGNSSGIKTILQDQSLNLHGKRRSSLTSGTLKRGEFLKQSILDELSSNAINTRELQTQLRRSVTNRELEKAYKSPTRDSKEFLYGLTPTPTNGKTRKSTRGSENKYSNNDIALLTMLRTQKDVFQKKLGEI